VSLRQLTDQLAGARLVGLEAAAAEKTMVSGVRQDSRQVSPGELFVALRGVRSDGADFIAAAAERGAVAVLLDGPRQVDTHGLPRLEVAAARPAMARAAALVYGRPTDQLAVVGITGTNGKTTTAHLVVQCLVGAGGRPGLIGTLGYRFEQWQGPSIHTSPEADELQRIAATMVKQGAEQLVMEVSSIALAAARVMEVKFRLAAFTNLTQDHLDYHGSMEAYAAAKERLFFEPAPAVAVVNIDDSFGASLATRIEQRGRSELIRVSASPDTGADVYPATLEQSPSGIRMSLCAPSGGVELTAPLVGAHNVDNLLSAAAIVHGLGMDLPSAMAALAAAPAVPGRLERCDEPGRDNVVAVVDYAHTPDALTRVLGSVRHLTAGRLWCVFGCGGDRDQQKRAPMGRAVGLAANYAILTNDNPRSEDPSVIAAAVQKGLDEVSACYEVELDRGKAIEQAILGAAAGDVVLIAGKGHEPYQIIGTNKTRFDDREQVRRSLAERRREGESR